MQADLAARLRCCPGWHAEGDLLAFMSSEMVTYAPGDDRATGYFADDVRDLVLGSLLDRLESFYRVRFPIVAFQAYRNGAGTEWHTDDPFDEQAVLSLGVTRTFAIRRNDGTDEHDFPVLHGDLVYMPSGFQDEYEHRVVPDDSTGERISLVFRTPKR